MNLRGKRPKAKSLGAGLAVLVSILTSRVAAPLPPGTGAGLPEDVQSLKETATQQPPQDLEGGSSGEKQAGSGTPTSGGPGSAQSLGTGATGSPVQTIGVQGQGTRNSVLESYRPPTDLLEQTQDKPQKDPREVTPALTQKEIPKAGSSKTSQALTPPKGWVEAEEAERCMKAARLGHFYEKPPKDKSLAYYIAIEGCRPRCLKRTTGL